MPGPLPPSPTPAQCAFLRGDAARAGAAAARSVWAPLPLAAQQDPQTDPVETRFFFFFFFKKKKTKKEIQERSERSTRRGREDLVHVPLYSAVRLVVQARPARAQRWEPASAWSPPVGAKGAQAQPSTGWGQRTRGHSPWVRVPVRVAMVVLTYEWPADSPDPPGAPSAERVSG